MKTRNLSWELETLANHMPENWHGFMDDILIHVNRNLPGLYLKNWRMVPQILLALSPDNIHAFISFNRHVPRNVDQLFQFWNGRGGSDYFRLLEETVREKFERETFERRHMNELQKMQSV